MSQSFCVKCKAQTGNANPRGAMSKNGKPMVRSTCTVCGSGKCQFVSKSAIAAAKPKGLKGKKVQGDGFMDFISGLF